MAYHFERDDASVGDGLRRIALEQIDAAIADVDSHAPGNAATVHEVRKCCKKIRGLVRLVRPAFPDYRTENAAFREAARGLAPLRDLHVQLGTCDSLATACEKGADRRRVDRLRRHLALRMRATAAEADFDERLAVFRDAMSEARERIRNWRLEEDGFTALEGGAARTYGRARNAMTVARKARTPDNLHEWRKRIKYHWYHARLLAPIWTGPMKAHRKAADGLGELLGDHHDLAVLAETIRGTPDIFSKQRDTEACLGLIRRRQMNMERRAFRRGARLLAESPEELMTRWETCWNAWREKPAKRADSAAA